MHPDSWALSDGCRTEFLENLEHWKWNSRKSHTSIFQKVLSAFRFSAPFWRSFESLMAHEFLLQDFYGQVSLMLYGLSTLAWIMNYCNFRRQNKVGPVVERNSWTKIMVQTSSVRSQPTFALDPRRCLFKQVKFCTILFVFICVYLNSILVSVLLISLKVGRFDGSSIQQLLMRRVMPGGTSSGICIR